MKLRLSLFLVLLLNFSILKANDLTLTPILPNLMEVCKTATFGLIIENTGTDTTKNITIDFQFTAGVAYELGSVNGAGAAELNVTNLNQPTFTLPNMIVGQKDTLWLTAKANCSLVAAINAATIFTNTITANYTGGSKFVITQPYVIETALLVISNVSPIWTNGYIWNDQLTRTVTIKNTRLGSLTNFDFVDAHGGELEITTALGTPNTSNPNEFRINLSGADFQTIGDGDTLFELNETIVITENITIKSCGGTVTSNIKAQWGCDGNLCQEDVNVAAIGVNPSPYAANLEFRPTVNYDDCYCGDNAVPQQMVIKNNGNGEAIFPIFSISGMPIGQFSDLNAIDASSLQITHNGTVTTPTPFFTMPTQNNCFTPTNLDRKVDLALPNILPGDSLIINWNMYFCIEDQDCSELYSGWVYDYSFYDNCPDGQFTIDTNQIAGLGRLRQETLPNSVIMYDSSITTFIYNIVDTGNVLLAPNGFIQIDMNIPCGMSWVQNPLDFLMGGTQSPSSFVHDTANGNISAIFPLPIATPQMNFTLILDCDEPCAPDPADGLLLSANIFLDSSCDTSNCDGLPLCTVDWAINKCPSSAPGLNCFEEDTLVGANFKDFQIDRINFGQPDNNDDKVPEPGTVNMNLVNPERAMMGDTIRERVKLLVLDELHQNYNRAKWESTWRCSYPGSDFYLPGGFTMESNYVEIHDVSSGNVYVCPNLDVQYTYEHGSTDPSITDSLSYHINLNPSYLNTKCGVPSNFEYEERDSIVIENIYKIRHNFEKDNNPNQFEHDPSAVYSRPRLHLSNDNYFPDYFHYCDTTDGIEVSGFRAVMSIGQTVVRPCDTTDFTGLNSIFFYLTENNYFPFEYREFASLIDVGVLPDPNFQVYKSQIVQAGIPPASQILMLQNPITINNIGANGYQYFDLQPFQDTIFDEGFYYFLQHVYDADCDVSGNFPVSYDVQLQLSKELDDSLLVVTNQNASGIRTLRPNFTFFIGLQNIIALSTTVDWSFDLKNNVTTSGGLQSEEVLNAWVHPHSPDGTLTNFTLVNTVTSQTYPIINGIFQLGDIQKNELLNLQLFATNNGCDLETVKLYYGWNCSQYTTPFGFACSKDSVTLTVQSIRPELEMTLTSPAINTFPLCTNIPYHTAKVFNAELGLANSLKLEAILPQGLSIVSGSCQLSYPDGTAFVNITDPVNIQGNIWQWDVSSLNATLQANGLKGVNDYPNNTFNVRFNLIADCDYIAGSYVVLRARGDNNCSDPTNQVSRATNPINISGAVAAYNSLINVTMDTVAGCTNSLNTRIDITISGTSSSNDSIFVSLPPNITYISNSYSTISNATSNAPFIENVDGVDVLKWKINTGLTAGSTISFQFQTEDYRNFACGEELFFFVQTVSPANALCASSGTTCNILVSTGQTDHKVRINRAILDMTNLTFTATSSGNQDLVRRSMTIQNNGATILPTTPIVIQYYHDVNGDGQITAADILLHTETKNLFIQAGGFWNLTTADPGFLTPVGAYCNIIAVIDTTQNCICEGTSVQSYAPISYTTPVAQICPNTDFTIGQTTQPSIQYQWLNNLVACDTCSQNVINLSNTSTSVAFQSYTLQTTTAMGCVTNFDYTVGVNPQMFAFYDSLEVCLGDSVNLAASAATGYSWAGQNLNNAFIQNPSALPASSQLYSVSIIDNIGCTSTDSTWVTVHTLPVGAAGSNQGICDNVTSTQLQAIFDTSYTYQWSPIGTINNPFIHNPIVFPSQTTVYTLVITDGNGCQSTDQATVFVAQSPAPTSETISLCQGEVFNYQGMTIDSAGTYDFVLTAYNSCDSLHTLTISYRDTAFTEEFVSICTGDSVQLAGTFYKQTGVYCHYFTAFNGCDSLVCLNLDVTDNIETFADTTICPEFSFDWNSSIYEAAGDYTQTFIADNGCDSTHQFSLNFFDEMVLDYEEDVFAPVGTSYEYSMSGGLNYFWTPNDYLSCDNCPDPIITPNGDIEYTVRIIDENGCQKTVKVKVAAPNTCIEGEMGIPNLITPNGDGRNDEFGLIEPYGISNFRMRIYNRWGQKIYETTNPFDKWNGYYEGKLQSQESYVYIIEGDCVMGDEFYWTGSFLIGN